MHAAVRYGFLAIYSSAWQGNLVKVLVSRISSAGVLHSQHEEWLETVALEGVVLRAITNHARTQAILLVVYPPCEPMVRLQWLQKHL